MYKYILSMHKYKSKYTKYTEIVKNESRIINYGFHPYQNVQNFEANPIQIVPDARNTVKGLNLY